MILVEDIPNGTNIVSAVGQHKLVDDVWDNNNINGLNLTHPITPDLPIGSYEFRVRVTDNLNNTGPWSDIVTFQVSGNCGGDGGEVDTNFDGTYYHYILSPCNVNVGSISVKSLSSIALFSGIGYQISGSGFIAYDGYIDQHDNNQLGIETVEIGGNCP
jgi:hypothetical protein